VRFIYTEKVCSWEVEGPMGGEWLKSRTIRIAFCDIKMVSRLLAVQKRMELDH